jgi:hypothetical protein
MKQTDARALFPNHKLKFSLAKDLEFGEKFLTVYAPNSNDVAASVNLQATKVVVCITRSPKKKSDVPVFTAFAEIGQYKGVGDFQWAFNVDRKAEGLDPVDWETARQHYNKLKEKDFDFAIEMLSIYFGVYAGTHSGFTREHYKALTTKGKQLYRAACAFSAGSAKYDPNGAKAVLKAPVTSPVTQLAKTLHEGKAKRTARDQRTVWDAEDDAAKSSMMFDHMTRFVAGDNDRVTWNEEDDKVFAMVEHDHKLLSDRLAALHSARGSKISIPEFDRRRKAQQEKQNG